MSSKKNESHRKSMRGFTLFVILALVLVGSVADQGCGFQPPPAQASPTPGPLGPTGTTTSTATGNPPTVQVVTANVTEVTGYAYDTANPTVTNSGIRLDLLPGDTAPTTATVAIAQTTVNAAVQSTVPNAGFRFDLAVLDAAKRAQVAAGKSIIVRATKPDGQFANTAARTIAGTTTGSTTTAP